MFQRIKNSLRSRGRKFFGIDEPGVIPKEYIAIYLDKSPIILEAGACAGEDTVEMARYWPDSKIYAFEPVNEIFDALETRTKPYKNIWCQKVALSDSNGETKMYVGGASSSILKPKEHLKLHPTIVFDSTQVVPTITLDSWAKKNKVKKIDFLWLDLQGAELKVLKASKQMLKTVKVIYTEVSVVEIYEGTPSYFKLKSWLESKGFRVVREEIPNIGGGNVLFVRK